MNMNFDELYDVFSRRDTSYAAMIFVGVSSTGVFCRVGCPARIPKPENCHFYDNAEAALNDGYRACKRCHPMKKPGEATTLVKRLINLVEDDPERRWGERELQAEGIAPSTARRQFKARFDMTFSDYARRRRMALATQALSKGEKVIEAQLSAGYDSPSGFRTAFAKTFGKAPKDGASEPLLIEWLDTPLGPMVAICDSASLYLLEFTNRKNLQRQFERLSKRRGRAIIPGRTAITDQIEGELDDYFAGRLAKFQTPLALTGTDFQKSVWNELMKIPYGETSNYDGIARRIGRPGASRAVGTANGDNRIAIMIPCHRVIRSDGSLSGYGGGVWRKRWMLDHERHGLF